MLDDILRPIIGIALHWYYRSIRVANMERIPRDGPVFLAANHPNSLTDAMVLGWSSPRRVRFTAKATLFSNPLAAACLRAVGVIPLRRSSDERASADVAGTVASGVPDASRNVEAFAAVADALAQQSCIVVFPEGKTHDEPSMAPLRTGLARMALMARDRGVRGIRIVPVGLLFEQKAEPRTRILLQVGEPIDVDTAVAGPSAVVALTDLVNQRLRAVTLNFESRRDAERIQSVGDMLAALTEPTTGVGEGAPSLTRTLTLVRRITRAHEALAARADPSVTLRLEQFEQRLQHLREQLTSAHLDVHDLAIDVSSTMGARFVLREAALAAMLLPVSLWGRVTHVLPIRLTRALALRNVRALDEPPMRTFVVGLVLVLSSYAVFTTAVAFLFGPWLALAFFLTLIPSASADLRYADRVKRVVARARAYQRFRREPSWHSALLADAEWIRVEAGALEHMAMTG